MTSGRPSSRKRILTAAAELAREGGPVRFSLDAVAARAGVSKGGLLYNFPTKAKLIEGLVEQHIEEFERALEAATVPDSKGGGETLLAAYVRLSARECEEARPAPSWIFAAMAEDPGFLKPIVAFRRRLLDRLRAEAPDPTAMLTVFLAIEGLRSMKLFGLDILAPGEHRAVAERLVADSSYRAVRDPVPAG